jgi:cytochrome c oxidase subunit 2
MHRLHARPLVAAAALLAAGCEGVQPMMAPGGPQARQLAHLGWFVLITFCAVTVVMWVLIFRVAARRRGTLAEHAPYDAPSDKRWIVVGGFLIPTIILGTIFVVTLRSMAAFPTGDDEMHAGSPAIAITGHQWWWEIEYRLGTGVSEHFVTANEVHVPAGRPVDIELRSRDVIHSSTRSGFHGCTGRWISSRDSRTASGSSPTSRASTGGNAPSTAARSTPT